ncbi:MFS transporter [Citricoccus sp.]|uniref:MFS transporter n=1 Tax=Citricoccus sp. TaxID=1978372 RepID=UPI0028BE7D64|nr:MFS transporter [Citricoccus sp.]
MTACSTEVRHGSGMGAAVAGMLLIAATYGMARFGVGLFAPYLAADRPELLPVLGWAAGAQFTSYAVAATLAARLVSHAPRRGLILAGVTATVGCLGVAVATEPTLFIIAVFIGGMGGGFASPALVPIIDVVVAPGLSSTAQSVVNTGTAVGVVASGLLVWAFPVIGPAWLLMALACAASAITMWLFVRARSDVASSRSRVSRPTSAPLIGRLRSLAIPGLAAILAGAGSSLLWTFGPLILTESGPVVSGQVGGLWIALGLGGLLGTTTGAVVQRIGRRGGWYVCTGGLALASAGIALSVATGDVWFAYASMALFGAGYMGLTTVLILWARQAWPENAGAGTSVLFIALATGQALGSVGFGAAQELLNPGSLAVLAAGLCLGGGFAAVAGKR